MHTEWYLPHHRERIYTVGHLRNRGRSEIFPITGTDGENSISIIGHRDGYRRNMQTFSPDGITETLDTGQGGGRGHHVGLPLFCDMNYGAGIKTTTEERTIQARYYKGVCNRKSELSGVCVPVLTPDREKKRQNGRRFKESGDPMFTLTAQDRHGVAVEPKLIGGIGEINFGKQFRQGNRIYSSDATAMCLNSQPVGNAGGNTYLYSIRTQVKEKRNEGIYVEMSGGFLVYCVWYEKYQCYIAIRRLTPKECFRLQGWPDEYFERAELVNSDSQLYKQAGNGVSVPVVKAIGDKIAEFERRREQNDNGK